MSGAKVGGETGTRVFPGSNLGGEGPQTGPLRFYCIFQLTEKGEGGKMDARQTLSTM